MSQYKSFFFFFKKKAKIMQINKQVNERNLTATVECKLWLCPYKDFWLSYNILITYIYIFIPAELNKWNETATNL